MLEIQKELGSLDAYLWSFVPNSQPIQTDWPSMSKVQAESSESTTLSKDLKKRGMTFVGPTIMQAFMQSTGMLNDHQTTCFRPQPIKDMAGT